MNEFDKRHSGRPRRTRGGYTAGSGNAFRLHQSLSDRLRASKQSRAMQRAMYLSTLPKNPLMRIVYRLHPRRLAKYWFSREGAIMALKVIGVGIVAVFLLTIGVFAYFRKDLPNIKDISGDNLGGSITYYDSTGKTVLWQDYNAVKRIPIPSSQISPYIKEATVAIEDRNFYHEGAFNFGSIVRAAFHDVAGHGAGLQGASTITEQLVKLNEQWTSSRTITTKVKELILAVELSREYSKDDILTGYLNIAPYGGVEYGIEAAAEDYFHTSAANLTLSQAAMLAAIPQDPPYYSPYSSPQYNPEITADYFGQQALLNRQHYILDLMAQQNMVTQQQADAAKQVEVLAQVQPLKSKYQGIKAPYFVLAAKQELEQQYGSKTVQRGGWNVITTLNLNLQAEAEKVVADNYANVQHLTGGAADEEAVVSEDVQTGQIVALVGGTNFNDPNHGQNNYAAGILVPPGSSFKPYDYSTLINNNSNVGAGSVLYDAQTPLPGYPCTVKAPPPPKGNGNCLEDYDFIYPGPEPIRYALGGSRNVPAVKAMLSAVPNDSSPGDVNSINKTISTASSMMDNPYEKSTYNCYSDAALTKTTQCYGASAIGDGAFLYLDDHVNGLSTLGRLGAAIPRTFILKITDSSGKAIYQWSQPKPTQAINKDTAYILDNMLSDPNASYLPGSCSSYTCSPSGYKFQRYNGWDIAVKTGTTNNGFDGLMTAFSSKYAVVTWVGNHNRNVDLSAAHGTAMEYLTEPMAKPFIEYALKGLPPENWQQPSDIKVLPAYVQRNHIHFGDVEPSPSMDLYPSWYQPRSVSGAAQTIDKVSGKLATSCTPADAQITLSNSNANSFSVDKFVSGALNTSITAGSDDVHNCSDSTPTITLTAPGSSVCSSTDNGGQGCQLVVTVSQGTHPLSSSQFPGTVVITASVNGGPSSQIASFTLDPSTGSVYTSSPFYYQPTTNGTVTLTATITDSVLYQNTNAVTLNTVFTGGGGNGNENGGGGHGGHGGGAGG